MNSNPETAEELKEQIRVLRGGIERLGKVIDQIAQYCQKLQLNNEPYPTDLTIQLKVSDDIFKIIGQLSVKPIQDKYRRSETEMEEEPRIHPANDPKDQPGSQRTAR